MGRCIVELSTIEEGKGKGSQGLEGFQAKVDSLTEG